MEILSKSLEETRGFAKNFLRGLKKNNKKATVVGLYGNLGSGKTTFVQFISKALGIKENITSPTFVIEKIYPVKSREAEILPKIKLFNRINLIKSREAGPPIAGFNKASKMGKENWPKRLIHIDAYRLEKGEELKTLGFDEILYDSENLILIEWPKNVSSILPEDILKVEFEFVDENTRSIKILNH